MKNGPVLVGLLLLAGCSEGAAPPDPVSRELFMPTLAEPTDTFPSAQGHGSLVLREPCLFLETEEAPTYLIIWPYGWDVSATTGGSIAVVDEDGSVRYRVGEEIELGGGELTGPGHSEELIGEPIPDACRAENYWIASP